MRLSRAQLAAIAAVAAWVLTAIAGRAPLATRPLVLVVSLDTVRADVLGTYGGRAITPHLDAFAHDAAKFTRHFAAAPTTLASHASLFTGQWPHTHGVPRNGFVLDAAQVTLAELLTNAGYETAGFVGSITVGDKTQISQGFSHWDDDTHDERPGAEVIQRTLDWLDRLEPDGTRPLFLFVHLNDAHAPYDPPPGYLEAQGGPWADTPLERGTKANIDAARLRCEARESEWKREGDELEALYSAGVSWLDHQVGRLLGGLAARGLLEEALVVITADHGEAYDAHEECWNHGYTVYDETTHVPLLVRGPGLARGEVGQLGSNVDVFPTVLDLLRLAQPTSEGVSFAPLLRGEVQAPRGVVFSEATKPYTEAPAGWANAERRKAARSPTARLVWDPLHDTRQLFLLDEDAAEAIDRWPALGETPAARALDLSLAAWAAQNAGKTASSLDDTETRAALRALGYVE